MDMSDVDSFYYDLYNKPPTVAQNPRQVEVAVWAEDDSAVPQADATVAQNAAVQLGNEARVMTVNDVLGSQEEMGLKIQQVQGAADRMDTPDTAEAIVGLHERLAYTQDDIRSPAVANRDAWLRRVATNLGVARQGLADFNLQQIESREKSALGFDLTTIGEGALYVARSFFSPDSVIKAVSVAQKHFPDVNWSDYVAPAAFYEEFGRKIRNSDEATSRMVVQDALHTLNQPGFLGTDNSVERQEQAQMLFSALDDDLTAGQRFLTNLGSAAAYLGPVGLVVPVARTAQLGARVGRVVSEAVDASVGGAIRAGAARHIPDEAINAVLPKIAVGSTADAATMTTAGAAQAVRLAASEAGSVELAARGTTPEQVAGSLLLPKRTLDLDELGRPYVDPQYVTPDMAADVQQMVRAELQDVLQLRLKDVEMGALRPDGGFDYVAPVGNAKGQGYVSREFAENIAREQFGEGNFTIIQSQPLGAKQQVFAGGPTGRSVGPQFFIGVKGTAYPTVSMIKSNADLVKYPLLRHFGRAVGYSDVYNRRLSDAYRQSMVTAEQVNQMVKPYFSLSSHRRVKVDSLIEEQDRIHTFFDRATATARGLDDAEVDALLSYNRLTQLDHAMTDFNVRHQMQDAGYLFGKVGGEEAFGKKVPALPSWARASDVRGNPVASANAGDTVLELVHETSSNITHVVVPAGRATGFGSTYPTHVVKRLPGYMVRRNEFSFYVRDVTNRRMAVGAMSPAEANRAVVQLKARNPGVEYAVIRSSETDPAARAALSSDIERMKSQNLLRTQRRNPDALKDITGRTRLMDVEQGIKTMGKRTADNAGVNRFIDMTLHDINRRIKAIAAKMGQDPNTVGVSLGSEPRFPAGRLDEADRVALRDANAVYKHLELLSGTSRFSVSRDIDELKLRFADFFYNAGDRGVPGARALANNLSGQTNSAETLAKTTGFYVYLGSNVFRNPLTQTSMIPVYGGLKGVGRYALSGQYSKDLAQFGFGVVRDVRPSGDAGKLFDLWKTSGLSAAVQNHALLSQTIFDSGLRIGGIADDSIGALLRGTKRAGFDLGTTLDKMGAMTAATRQWRANNGMRWPTTKAEIDEVFAKTEELTFNQNQTDPLPLARGSLGVMMQFMSYTVKASTRVLGLEGTITPAERIRMAGLQMLSYGTDGLKFNGVVQAIENHVLDGERIDPRIREMLQQGFYGTLANTMMGAATDTSAEWDQWMNGVEGSRTNFSGAVSPFNFVGPTLNSLSKLLTFSASLSDLKDISPPIVNFVGDVGETLKLGYLLSGSGLDLPTGAVARAVMTDFIRKVPITNNIFKAYVAATYGYTINGDGDPVVEATLQDALFALAGIESKDAQGQRALQELQYGPWTGGKDANEAIYNGIAGQARDNANWIIKGLRAVGVDGGLTSQQFRDNLLSHTTAYRELLTNPADRNLYFTTLTRELDKQGILRSEKLLDSYLSQLRIGKISINHDVMNAIRATDSPQAEAIIEYMQGQMDLGAAINSLMEGDNGGSN